MKRLTPDDAFVSSSGIMSLPSLFSPVLSSALSRERWGCCFHLKTSKKFSSPSFSLRDRSQAKRRRGLQKYEGASRGEWNEEGNQFPNLILKTGNQHRGHVFFSQQVIETVFFPFSVFCSLSLSSITDSVIQLYLHYILFNSSNEVKAELYIFSNRYMQSIWMNRRPVLYPNFRRVISRRKIQETKRNDGSFLKLLLPKTCPFK